MIFGNIHIFTHCKAGFQTIQHKPEPLATLCGVGLGAKKHFLFSVAVGLRSALEINQLATRVI